MKTRLLKFLKTILISALIWLALSGAFVAVDGFFGLSEKIDWLPMVFLLLPIFLSVAYIIWAVLRENPTKVPEKAKPAAKEASKEPTPPQGSSRRVDEVMSIIDAMDGHDFEQLCAEMLERNGFKQVHVTKGSGDQGVDIIAIKYGRRYAFQCKRYSSKLGNKPVQEVHTGKQFYSCQVGVVITNSYFTKGAEDAARRVGVELWDRDTLIRKMGYRTQTASTG